MPLVPTLIVPGITDPSTLACLARSRKYTQYVQAVEAALAGKCQFCDIDRTYNEVILENELALAWPCKPPEKHTRFHFLIVPKRHVTDSTDLTAEELLMMMHTMPRELMKMFGFKSRGVLMRDGDATLSAGTIQHLHMHIMVPDGSGRVESPFYKGFEAEAEGVYRAVVFEKLRTGTKFEDLEPHHQKLVEGRL